MKRKSYKLQQYIIALCFILSINFLIPRLMPGDPFTFLSSDEGQVNSVFAQEDIEKYKAYYGLDKPMIAQAGSYIKNLLKGDLGYSIFYKEKVAKIIVDRLGWTFFIVISASFLSALFGIAFGCISAYYKGSILDKLLNFLFVALSEIPSFLIGLLLLFTFAANLKWFPLSGGMTHFSEGGSLTFNLYDKIRHAVLPVTSLAIAMMGHYYLLSRASLIKVMDKAYIKTAKAKGLKNHRVLFVHGLKNALLPMVTHFFMNMGTMMGGAVLVENVFKYPGLGTMMRSAIAMRDYTLIQGIFLFMTVIVLAMNYFADRVYKQIDPRIRESLR